jgi:cell division transport system permease protein
MVKLLRILKYGVNSFLRNGWLSASTISIMVLALLVFEGLIMFNVISTGAITAIQEKIDISIYFKTNVGEDSILNIKRSLEGLTEVKSVEYISRDDALRIFRESHKDDPVITETLDQLDENPLLASLNIKAQDPRHYSAIASYLDKPAFNEQIEKITYAQNHLIIERLIAFVDTMRNGGAVLTSFLSFLAIMITFNTIRLAIFSNSEELSVMRLVGASNNFIRGPYIVTGVLYGIIGAFISFLLFIPILNFISPYISNFIPEISLNQYFASNFFSLLFYQILFGVGLGILSSVIAIRRYLHI